MSSRLVGCPLAGRYRVGQWLCADKVQAQTAHPVQESVQFGLIADGARDQGLIVRSGWGRGPRPRPRPDVGGLAVGFRTRRRPYSPG